MNLRHRPIHAASSTGAHLDRQDEVYARMMFALPKLFPKDTFEEPLFER